MVILLLVLFKPDLGSVDPVNRRIPPAFLFFIFTFFFFSLLFFILTFSVFSLLFFIFTFFVFSVQNLVFLHRYCFYFRHLVCRNITTLLTNLYRSITALIIASGPYTLYDIASFPCRMTSSLFSMSMYCSGPVWAEG
jgi:hypothetical protein